MPKDFTICGKVDKILKALELTMQTGELDVPGISLELNRIRRDAQRMENGLKRRKKFLLEKKLEVEYQKLKGKELTPEGINTIPDSEEHNTKNVKFELTITNGDEVLYKNKIGAGVLCGVEEIEGMDKYGHIDGRTQTFVFGRPLAYFFAFDQLRQAMEAKNMAVLADLTEAIKNNKLIDPEVRKQIVDAVNKTL